MFSWRTQSETPDYTKATWPNSIKSDPCIEIFFGDTSGCIDDLRHGRVQVAAELGNWTNPGWSSQIEPHVFSGNDRALPHLARDAFQLLHEQIFVVWVMVENGEVLCPGFLAEPNPFFPR